MFFIVLRKVEGDVMDDTVRWVGWWCTSVLEEVARWIAYGTLNEGNCK